jgi:hypothetical protein
MGRVIFDIETAGKDLSELEEPFRQYFSRWHESEEELQESLSFYPLTGEIVAIGLLNPDTRRGAVYFQAPADEGFLPFEEEGIRYEAGTEREVLEKFWAAIRHYDQFITFNGRGFDCPFILVRSAVHRVRPTCQLMPNRYGEAHIDLLDQLTFYGATRRRFSLELWCRALGIPSPKAELKGHEVRELFRQGRYLEIARYCVGDLWATKALLEFWENYIRFSPESKKDVRA